jgi:hypothetical protein
MRNGRGKRNGGRQGFLGRMLCRVERRVLGFGMRGVAVIADRQMSRYHAREAAGESDGTKA